MKELDFKNTESGEGANDFEDLRAEVTFEQATLIDLALERMLLDSPPLGIEETLKRYGYKP